MIVNTRNLIGHTTGVQRYTKSIIDHLLNKDVNILELSPARSFSSGIKGHIWEQFVLPSQFKKIGNGKQILWSPSNTGPLSIQNQVVTIHDTVPFDHPEWLNSKFVSWYKFMQPILVKKAKHIITISEFSKQKIMEHMNVPENRISVIYNGVDLIKADWNRQVEIKYSHIGRYILSVGSLEPRKNIQRLISAFEQFKITSKCDLKLVIVGKEGVDRVFKKEGANKNVKQKDIIYTGHISDAELNYLYTHAQGFCYPSMYEGFGLPPLEAMCYGIPVLTSDNSALKELCQNRAVLVDPFSVESISEGIFTLVNQSNSFINQNDNKDYAKSLTWSKCAIKTFDVINNV